MSLKVAALMPDEVQRQIGSSNRLLPGFHGTPDKMQMLWDGYVKKLRLMHSQNSPGSQSIMLVKKVVSTDHMDMVDTDQVLLIWMQLVFTDCTRRAQGTGVNKHIQGEL